MANDGDYTRGFILGTIIGGVAGGLTALLLAPKSGAELRKDIADASNDAYDKASDYLYGVEESVGRAVTHTVNEGREKAEGIITNARSKAEDLLTSAESILKEARGKATETKGQIQDRIDNIRDAAKASADAFKTEIKSAEK